MCEVVSAEPYELVWRTVPTALSPDSTEWAIKLREDSQGTTIEQRFQVIRAPKVLDVLYALLIPSHRDRTAALDRRPPPARRGRLSSLVVAAG